MIPRRAKLKSIFVIWLSYSSYNLSIILNSSSTEQVPKSGVTISVPFSKNNLDLYGAPGTTVRVILCGTSLPSKEIVAGNGSRVL